MPQNILKVLLINNFRILIEHPTEVRLDTELPEGGDEDGRGAERLPQEAEGGRAREEELPAPEQPHHQLTVPPSEQLLKGSKTRL